MNLVDQLTEPGGAITSFAYDNDDNRISTTYPNGVVQTAAYDASSRLTSIEGKRGSTVLTRFAYTYALSGTDTALRRTVKDKSNNTTTYSYDALDRLTRARTLSSLGLVTSDYQYTYDAAGRPDIEQALTPVEPEPAAAEPPAPAPPGLVAKAYPTGPPAPAGGCATNGSGNSSRSDLLRQAPRRR